MAVSGAMKEIEDILARRERSSITREGEVIYAAVMVTLAPAARGYEMLFIKRPESGKDAFSGHMAYPGGKCESADATTLETALRETMEEVGLDILGSGRVLGSLDDVNPNTAEINMYVVTPYVSLLPRPEEPKTNGEVARALWIPVSHLLDPANRSTELVSTYGAELVDYRFFYGDIVIWGMTGRILAQFIELTGHLL